MVNVCILGATSHVAQGLIYHFKRNDDFKLYLFARTLNYLPYDRFDCFQYDIIINCIGFGTFKDDFDYNSVFAVTEYYDDLIIKYLKKNKTCKYIYFSTGGIHRSIDIDNISKDDIHTITRINSEAKHRMNKDLSIINLRLYSYFSRWAQIHRDNYFMNQLIKSLITDKVFITDENEFTRDFIHPEDLFGIILKCMSFENTNCSFEIGSSQYVTKFAILNYFVEQYGLKIYYDIITHNSLTGKKVEYHPINKSTLFKSKYTSIETVIMESRYFLNEKNDSNNSGIL